MRLIHHLRAALLGGAMATAVACSSADAPMEPTSSTPAVAPSFRTTGAADSAADARKARHEQLKRLLEERKAWIRAERERTKADFEAQRALWKQLKDQWKKLRKGGQLPGMDLLRCEPKPFDGDAKIIGPEGGTLQMGEHQLEIPKGALTEEQLIVAEAPTTSLVEAQFEPEGLQFQVPAKLTLSYKGCQLPVGADLGVVYLGNGNRILELLPSRDDRPTNSVDSDIQHFSRYAVHY
jgi:hypothetical protein